MASKEASDWLGERLAEQRKQVEAAEAEAAALPRAERRDLAEDRENIVVQKLADLNAAVTRAKTERIQKEAMYQQLQSLQADPAGARHLPGDPGQHVHPAAEGASWRELQRQQAQLAEKLGDKHPEIVKLKSAIQSWRRRS